jgi:HEPN domain-containing protein
MCRKIFEGDILFSRREEGWGHSLFSLIENLKEIDKNIYDKFEESKEEVKKIDRFYIPTRYPNGLIDILPSQAFGEKDYLGVEGIVDKILKITREVIHGEN